MKTISEQELLEVFGGAEKTGFWNGFVHGVKVGFEIILEEL